ADDLTDRNSPRKYRPQAAGHNPLTRPDNTLSIQKRERDNARIKNTRSARGDYTRVNRRFLSAGGVFLGNVFYQRRDLAGGVANQHDLRAVEMNLFDASHQSVRC